VPLPALEGSHRIRHLSFTFAKHQNIGSVFYLSQEKGQTIFNEILLEFDFKNNSI